MNEVAVSEARNRLAEVIEETRRSGEPVSVTRRGRRVAVILDSDAFDRLVDSGDAAAEQSEAGAARRHSGLRSRGEVLRIEASDSTALARRCCRFAALLTSEYLVDQQ